VKTKEIKQSALFKAKQNVEIVQSTWKIVYQRISWYEILFKMFRI